MSDIVFNIAKGRAAELYNRVDAGDPAAARLYVIPVDRGATTDATLRDVDDFAAAVTAGLTERTTGGWNRKTLAAADLATLTADDTNDRMPAAIPAQLWTAVSAGTVTDLVICYSASASPTNSQLVPLTIHAFAITPDGSDVQANAGDFYRAT